LQDNAATESAPGTGNQNHRARGGRNLHRDNLRQKRLST
jgi:hypothetical protein